MAGLDALSERRRGGADVPALPVTGAVDFFAGFVARCHDAKEEEGLFPALAAYGAPDDGLIDTLRADHQEGDRLLGGLRPLASRQRVDGEAWTLLEAYLSVLRRHIASEDAALFPLAERLLSSEDDAVVQRAFLHVEERALGRAGSEALVALAGAVVDASNALAAEPPVTGAHLVARRIMRARPARVATDETLARAAGLMEAFGTRELPVVSGGTLVGILTRTDMEPHRGHYEWTAVRAAMTPNPVSVAPETPVSAVAGLLREHGFNAVPVTADGELVGMIARSDVLTVLAEDGTTRTAG